MYASIIKVSYRGMVSMVSMMVSKTTGLSSSLSTPAKLFSKILSYFSIKLFYILISILIYLFLDINLKISGKIFPEKFNNLFKKFLTVEVVLYIFFGVLTTVVNIGSFAIITSCFKLEENISNAIAIILAVLFAYFTNKDLVFNSKAESFKEKILEFFKFMLGRAFTMFVELIGFYLLFNILGIQKLISKTLITVIVIILNFFISKFFAFKK